ncbi:MAG: FAD-binding protein [Candidatus Nanopelagicaceae bacterium]|nr:FAD-binding protein [Candidatus Nanopelagicaceae bacterium]
MKSSTVDVLIVGAGPAGLAAAIELKRAGVKNVRIVEREKTAGGVPRHSFHPGYGLRDLKRFLSGPKYSRYYVNKALKNGVQISTSTTATDWIDPNTLTLTCPTGIEQVRASVILLATGARERGRAARAVAGKRPSGIYTTGSLQQATYLEDLYIGKTAVIVGTEHVSLSAVLTLKHAGVKTVAMICEKSKHQTVFGAPTIMKLLYRFKLHLATKIVEIQGDQRVTGVKVSRAGKEWVIAVDTIVFTGDWIPDHELARRGGIAIDRKYKSPITNGDSQIPNRSIYTIGNLNLPIKGADRCAVEARKIASKIAKQIHKGSILS